MRYRTASRRTLAAREARSRQYRQAVAMQTPAATPEAQPAATPEAEREEFRTYGTNRVYRHIPGVYHEPLAYVAKTPTAAKRRAALMNAKRA